MKILLILTDCFEIYLKLRKINENFQFLYEIQKKVFLYLRINFDLKMKNLKLFYNFS